MKTLQNTTASAKATAAAFFLLSLTIGTSHEAAEIVTNDPAAVFAQVAEAGETLTAFALEEIPTPRRAARRRRARTPLVIYPARHHRKLHII